MKAFDYYYGKPATERPADDEIAFNPVVGFMERGRYWTTQEEFSAARERDRQAFLELVRQFNADWVMYLGYPPGRRWYWHHWREQGNWIFRHGWYEPPKLVEFT